MAPTVVIKPGAALAAAIEEIRRSLEPLTRAIDAMARRAEVFQLLAAPHTDPEDD
jgi:hypothetical protein